MPLSFHRRVQLARSLSKFWIHKVPLPFQGIHKGNTETSTKITGSLEIADFRELHLKISRDHLGDIRHLYLSVKFAKGKTETSTNNNARSLSS